MRVLFVGEVPDTSAPSATLARALAEYGVESIYSRGVESRDTRDWLRLVTAADVIIVVKYGASNFFFRRQLSLAVAKGTPAIRWWVGTDVYNVLNDPDVQRSALLLNPLFARNLAVAPHLVDELSIAGIAAQFIPSVLNPKTDLAVEESGGRALLVYLPSKRREFYGASIVKAVIEEHRDVDFIVVADEPDALADLPNVTSLGWQADMQPIWNNAGGLLRITQHDGMPRMVLDALRQGKHVIYSWPFPGCILARSHEEVHLAVERFKMLLDQRNMEGMKAVEELLTPSPSAKYFEVIQDVLTERHTVRRLLATGLAVKESIYLKLSDANA